MEQIQVYSLSSFIFQIFFSFFFYSLIGKKKKKKELGWGSNKGDGDNSFWTLGGYTPADLFDINLNMESYQYVQIMAPFVSHLTPMRLNQPEVIDEEDQVFSQVYFFFCPFPFFLFFYYLNILVI